MLDVEDEAEGSSSSGQSASSRTTTRRSPWLTSCQALARPLSDFLGLCLPGPVMLQCACDLSLFDSSPSCPDLRRTRALHSSGKVISGYPSRSSLHRPSFETREPGSVDLHRLL